ncbi:accessory Sec system S-layer assembly protein [Anaerobacillus sp. MEB173]|uniref:accessory Sec system S-layer assembly protein n=1 Tax=Anaerobacillus sp. MEB173 TaxID=3383345 RepID=UPI003F8EF0E9
MLSFFRKKDGEKPTLEGNESTVQSKELIKEETATEEEEVYTELSIHPSWNINKEDMYAFQFLNQECPPLQPNQLSLYGINIMNEGDLIRVNAFVRNSLDKAITLEETSLVLLGPDDKILGRKVFQLSELGEIPARSSRPWHFYFTDKDLFTTEIPSEGWKLAFNLTAEAPKEHALDLDPNWKKALSKADKTKLKDLVKSLTPPNAGEVNFMGLQASQKENGDLHVTMLIRNGSEKNVNIEQLPLHVQDATGEIIAKGGFKLENFSVKANTSKPWTFIYPKSLVLKQDPDLSRWKAFSPQE